MTTANGIPLMFGGKIVADNPDEDDDNADTIYRFEDIDEPESETNEWKHAGIGMKFERYRHAVVAVPISFVCAEETSTSTER